MGSKNTASIAPFISVFNYLVFFALVNACASCAARTSQLHQDAIPESSLITTPATCPRDALQLGVCANVLRSLLNVEIGNPPVRPCCSLLFGLVDLEAAACLCTAIKANILGVNLFNIPVALSLLLNICGDTVPTGYQCA